jgi:hypothetical protein
MKKPPPNTDDPFETAERLVLAALVDERHVPALEAATRTARDLEGARGWKGRTQMTQCEKILLHFDKNGSITQREAIMDYSISSLTRRIADLREAGHDIVSVNRRHPTTGQDYVRYFPKAKAPLHEVA